MSKTATKQQLLENQGFMLNPQFGQQYMYPYPQVMHQPQMMPQNQMMQPNMVDLNKMSKKIDEIHELLLDPEKIAALKESISPDQQTSEDTVQTSRKKNKGKRSRMIIKHPELIPRFSEEKVKFLLTSWKEANRVECFKNDEECIKIAIALLKNEKELESLYNRELCFGDGDLSKAYSDVIIFSLLRDLEYTRFSTKESFDEEDIIIKPNDIPPQIEKITPDPSKTPKTLKKTSVSKTYVIKQPQTAYVKFTNAVRNVPENVEIFKNYDFSGQNYIISSKWASESDDPKKKNPRWKEGYPASQKTKDYFEKKKHCDQLRMEADTKFYDFERLVGPDKVGEYF